MTIIHRLKHSFYFIALMIAISGCVSPHQTFSKIAPGMWRGVLYLDNEGPMPASKKEIVQGSSPIGELPFNFDVVYDDADNFHLVIHNGEERIKVDNIKFGRDKQTAKDTLLIDFPQYDTYLKVLVEEAVMEGEFYVNYKDGYKIKFKAQQGKVDRFRQMSNNPPQNFAGRYAVTFSQGTPDAYPGIAVLDQKDSKLTGTFLTETGDYRYLEGKVVDNKAYLSCFDGAHAFLFEMKMLNGQLIGEFRSGTHHREPFEGVKNDNAKLKDGFDLVKKVSDAPLHFKLPDANGILFDTDNAEYKGKVKIYDVMGTWCPNCMDATAFLKEVHTKYPDVKITALSFERYKDASKAQSLLKKYVEKTDIPYPILLAGYYDKKEANLVIPQIEKIMAYPTLLLVDENDKLQKIYTGFYGPATQEHEAFKSSFLKTLDALIKH
jgi:thiol-disulfide isomerase/thioredoxin